METLIEIAVAIVCGGLGVFIFRILNPKSSVRENQQVIVKIEEKDKENEALLKKIEENMESSNKKQEELEKEKNKDLSQEQLEDFFNNRKH